MLSFSKCSRCPSHYTIVVGKRAFATRLINDRRAFLFNTKTVIL